MTESNEPQPAQKITGKAEYLPYSQTATLTDSNNNETVIRNVSQEAYYEISTKFLANTLMSSTKTGELSKALAASESDSLSSLMGAGVPETTKSKDQKKS